MGNKTILCLETNGKPSYVDFLSTNMDKSSTATKDLMVPESWQRNFGIYKKWRVPAGPNLLIIGRDAWDLAPIEVAREGKLSLLRSTINNEIILAGANNVDDYNSFVHCQRTRVTNSQVDAESKSQPENNIITSRYVSTSGLFQPYYDQQGSQYAKNKN